MKRAFAALVLAAALSACSALPPAPMDQRANVRLPDVFKEGAPGAYIIIYKGEVGAWVENRVRVDDGPYSPIGSNACVVWKVAPGLHTIEFDFWAGHDMTKVRLADGDRSLLEIQGAGGIVGRSMLVHGEKASALRLDAYIDNSRTPASAVSTP